MGFLQLKSLLIPTSGDSAHATFISSMGAGGTCGILHSTAVELSTAQFLHCSRAMPSTMDPESRQPGRETKQDDQEHGFAARSLGFCIALLDLRLHLLLPAPPPPSVSQVTLLPASSQLQQSNLEGDSPGHWCSVCVLSTH